MKLNANIFSLGTFNVRGLNDNQKKEDLMIDMKNYKLDVCCLQETKIQEGNDINIKDCRLITFSAKIQYYGTGFVVSNKWNNHLSKYWKVSERISVIQFRIKSDYKCKQVSETKVIIYRDIKYCIVDKRRRKGMKSINTNKERWITKENMY